MLSEQPKQPQKNKKEKKKLLWKQPFLLWEVYCYD